MNLGDRYKMPIGIVNSFNCESDGYMSFELRNGLEVPVVYCGLKDSVANANEQPELDYGSIFIDWITAFKNDEFELADSFAEKCLDYELKLTTPIENDVLSCSESNIEYCVLQDKDNGILFNSNNDINLLNPSVGTVSRFISTSYIQRVSDVYILRGSPSEYIDKINDMLSVFEKKVSLVYPKQLDKDKFYYLSFNAQFSKKFNLKHYFGYFPNYYQCVQQGLCDALHYSSYGVALTYHRKGVEIVGSQSYGSRNNIYASDVLLHRYRNRTCFNSKQSIMHDIYASYALPFSVPIKVGRMSLTNCMVLIGNYFYENNVIYTNRTKNHIIYSNSGKNHSCYDLNKLWVPCDAEGDNLYKASFAINMFSGICISLGEKFFVSNQLLGVPYIKYGDLQYSLSDYVRFTDIFIKCSTGKGRLLHNNVSVERLLKVVQPVHIHQFFLDNKYSYGTYHDLVFDTVNLDKTPLSSLIFKVTDDNSNNTFFTSLCSSSSDDDSHDASGRKSSVDTTNNYNKFNSSHSIEKFDDTKI